MSVVDPNGGGALLVPGGGGGPIPAADITDSTATGRAVLTGTAAEGRAALGPARALDADHIYAWRLDEAAGAGTIAAAVGSTALTINGSVWVQGDGGLYTGANALHHAAGGATTDRLSASLTAVPTGDISIEMDFVLAPRSGIVTGVNASLLSIVSGSVFLACAWTFGASGGMYCNASVDGGGEQSTASTPVPLADLTPGVAHHLLVALQVGAGASNGTLSLYLDGALAASVGSIRVGGMAASSTLAVLGHPSANDVSPVLRAGEIRISDVARDAAYARTAYAALRARS